MKKFLHLYKKRIKDTFTLFDYGFLKLYGAIFGLVLGAYFPEFVKLNLWFFVLVFLLLLIRYLYLLFIKATPTTKVI